MKAAYDRAMSMRSPDYRGTLSPLLKRKKYSEAIEETEEVLTFLQGIGKIIS